MKMGPAGLFAASSLAGAAIAAAPQPSAEAASPSHTAPLSKTVEGVTVTAPMIKSAPAMVQSFAAPRQGYRLARWRDELCIYVRGLTPEHDVFVGGRVLQIADAAGIRVAKGHCDANLIVLFTPYPDQITRSLSHRYRLKLNGQSHWPIDRLQLMKFTAADGQALHMFRIWDIAPNLDNGDGAPLDLPSTTTTGFNFTMGVNGPPVINTFVGSRLTPATDRTVKHLVAVVDSRRMVGFTPTQIAAYVALSTLAEINAEPPADGVPTIATLPDDAKAGRQTPPDLTFWDRAYLGALYKAPSQANIDMQESLMATRIRKAAQQQIRVDATEQMDTRAVNAPAPSEPSPP